MTPLERVVAGGAGILFVVLAIPMITRRVPPNAWYGVRTTETLGDDWIWYEVNAKSGWGFLILGVALTVIAILVNSELLLSGAAVIGAVAWGAWSVWLGRNLTRSARGGTAANNRLAPPQPAAAPESSPRPPGSW